jgi:chromate transport protein ChrA
MTAPGPRLPSPTSAPSDSYLGISCRRLVGTLLNGLVFVLEPAQSLVGCLTAWRKADDPAMPDDNALVNLLVLVGIIVVIGLLVWKTFR